MLAFADAVQHASVDSLHLSSADFAAVERWASLVMRRGHWAYGAMPPAGEERARYLGMLAWYGVAPPAPDADRVWVGPRVLVREGDTEGFVTDEIPATEVGCPIGWRTLLRDQETNTNELASAWLSDHPEFAALATFADRIGRDAMRVGGRGTATRASSDEQGASSASAGLAPGASTADFSSRVTVRPLAPPGDSARPARALPGDTLAGPDSSRADSLGRGAATPATRASVSDSSAR
jgi:hypothetical protein